MNKFAKISAFSILGLALMLSPHVSYAYYASTPTVNKFTTTVSTEKKSYSAGETINLSGQATPYEQGRKLSVIVRDTASNIMLLKTVPVNSDGTYSYSITDTSSWKKGNYNVAAQYGSSDVNIGTSIFSFDPSVKAEPTPVPATTSTATPTTEKTDSKNELKMDAKVDTKKKDKKAEPKAKDTKKKTKKVKPKNS